MLIPNTHERVSEQTEIELRQMALKALVTMRTKQLHESLDHRIKRATQGGAWIGLSRAACRRLYSQEQARLQEQLAELQSKQAHLRERLTEARKAVARARRLKASRDPATRK